MARSDLYKITPSPKNMGVVNKITLRITNAKVSGGLNNPRTRRALEKVVDDAIRKRAEDFIPTDKQAVELGVGNFAGGLDRHRLATAWTHLLLDGPEDGNKVTLLSITTRTGAKVDVSRIKVRILEEGFLALPINNLAIESVELPIIPWMDWFLNGAVIGGFRFSSKPPIPATSRTGGGIMITGGLWNFPPQGLGVFNKLINTIDRDLHQKMITILKIAIRKLNIGKK